MKIDLKDYILDVVDFPKPGVLFKDITPIVQSSEAFNAVIDQLTAWARTKKPELIIGIESRGFLFAAALARDLRLGLTVIRKKGKLPRKCAVVEAPNEYAVEHFEMHEDAVARGQRVVIIDDLIATGSSSVSAIDLVQKLAGDVVGFGAVVELSFLHGVEKIRAAHPEVEVRALVRY
ncbi:MAG TPA: adenine phosphoribosyltransferase [Candidatus Aminicenantes bacterium]|nr:adenine phosphoribosyltransferase [Candidatus Aminicenantes bacterium]HRY66225.1 adenine phosphoribosyltransferase [Candidatus Aminicenantes bacterium]HRZ73139.1 adenine phosphoribosyltransferase [Candidatus Aminicenantes bacterium]